MEPKPIQVVDASEVTAQAPVASKPLVLPVEAGGLVLPIQVITHTDISRLIRETENLEDFFVQSSLKGAVAKNMPQLSLLMTSLANENKLNLLHKEERQKVISFLNVVRDRAPVVHASFAVDPKPDFLMKILRWFRTEAHPYTLFRVGLQPQLAAGCIIRTTNKYFDFSFRKNFETKKEKLADALRGVK